MLLEQIGADVRVRELFRPYEADGLELGRVSFAAREQYRVCLESADCEAVPAGRLRWEDTLPAVGDWVAARRVDAELALIEAVLPRRTQFSRRAPGSGAAEQVIAANVDVALVVCGLDGDFNLRRLERYLVLARESGAEPVLVLSKADLCEEAAERVEAVRRIAPGVPVVPLNARETVEPLRPLVRGRTVALVGSSGAGKSTIANGLLRDSRQATQAVRDSDSRGRHTTTSRMLLRLEGGGAIIDNPGMRELQLWAGEDALDGVFDDIAELGERCRFRDCTHAAEPGCAVREALERGELDASRWESYRKLGAELRHRAVERGTQSRLAERKKWRAIHKAMKAHPKYNR
ncbi:MAG TPA: ribosome small subunit-dependent GTPase A [Bryobacteraceae bacterium]